MQAARIAILVPCYNAADTIAELVTRISSYASLDDVYVVDDGSVDGSRAAIVASGAHLLVHEQNRGKGEALRTGFDEILSRGYTGAITLDADLQHLPEHLPAFLKVVADYDIVVGTRDYNLRNMPVHRWATNRLTSLIVSWLGRTSVRDCQSGYRYCSDMVMRDVPLSTANYDMEAEQLIRSGRMGLRIGAIPVKTVYRGSASYINPVVDTIRFIRMAFRNMFWRAPG
jgi:glycosyltransferase involved in cell wall biosynthesis